MKNFIALTIALSAFTCSGAIAAPAPQVSFVTPKDGDTVAKTFKVEFKVEGMKIVPAGKAPTDKTSGHHHLIIDGGPIAAGTIIASDATHIHYGKGQTSAELTLPPGNHKLTLQFADGLHSSYGPALSQTINVTVK